MTKTARRSAGQSVTKHPNWDGATRLLTRMTHNQAAEQPQVLGGGQVLVDHRAERTELLNQVGGVNSGCGSCHG